MQLKPKLVPVLAAAVAIGLSVLGLGGTASGGAASGGAASLSGFTPNKAADEQLFVYRVPERDARSANDLQSRGFDLVEGRIGRDLLVLGNRATQERLTRLGYHATIHQTLTPASGGATTDVFDGGYRTVDEQYAHLTAVAAAKPNLAKVVTYGQSWRKLHGQPGYDLQAVCITKRVAGDCALTPTAAKPRFLLMAQIHARELTTGDLAFRFVDDLVSRYNKDAEVTALLNSTEVWVVPIANPDGTDIVQQGGSAPFLQRKNANDTVGSCPFPPTATSQAGVDLNRNAGFQYGGLGSSTAPCSQTYKGVGADSEPELSALESLFGQLFADQRGPALDDAAPTTTSGAMITLHSYSDLVLLPWGFTNAHAPNDAELRAMAFRLSFYNGYQTGQPGELLYNASGTTDDWSYGTLGIASFTFEVGPTSGGCAGFTPPYSCQDSTFWPLNRDALLYAAKAARAPFSLPLGPSAILVKASGTGPFALKATVDTARFGNAAGSVGRPTPRPVASAEYFVDTPPWAGGVGIPMTATDGTFDATAEAVKATIGASLSSGRHLIYVRGTDDLGRTGPVTAAFLRVP